MKTSILVLPALLTLAAARDNIFNFNALIKARSNPSLIQAREVPQEHSHEKFLTLVSKSLNLNNPDQIQDPVFGLLGAKAAAGGKGKIADANCLQQATADQAFTNAKKAGDVIGMTAALVYRSLERNSGAVGALSPLCNSTTAVNPEIAALQQHQDPASPGAAALNKKIALDLAQLIKSIGGDPLTAIESGTFAPGNTNDSTARGNTCDTQDDPEGCIFTQNLLVPDVTPQEIQAAIAEGSTTASANNSASDAATATSNASTTDDASPTSTEDVSATTTEEPVATDSESATATDDTTPVTTDAASSASATDSAIASDDTTPVTTDAVSTPSVVTVTMTTTAISMVTVTADCAATTTDAEAPALASPIPPAATTSSIASITSTSNLQSFTGTLGSPPVPIENVGGSRPFVVNGNSFVNFAAACQRSCDIQNNKCSNVANAGAKTFSVSDCGTQSGQCGTNCQKGPE